MGIRLLQPSRRVAALLSCGTLFISGCSAMNNSSLGEDAQLAATGTQPVETQALAENEEEVKLVNTSSVLFPMHTLTQEALQTQMLAYIDAFDQVSTEPFDITNKSSSMVRNGPGFFYETMKLLPTGTTVTVDGQLGSWFRLADGSGYVPLTDFYTSHESSADSWYLTVSKAGDSEDVDACDGKLTEYLPMSEDLGVPVWGIHSYCGGDAILGASLGEHLSIEDPNGNRTGYVVYTVRDYQLFGSTESMKGDPVPDAFLFTCDLTTGTRRALGLVYEN